MPPQGCSANSTAAAGALLVAAVGLRASWLGVATARAVCALAWAPVPSALAQAAHSSATRASCVDSREQVAFCTGLWRPRI